MFPEKTSIYELHNDSGIVEANVTVTSPSTAAIVPTDMHVSVALVMHPGSYCGITASKLSWSQMKKIGCGGVNVIDFIDLLSFLLEAPEQLHHLDGVRNKYNAGVLPWVRHSL